MFLRQVELGVVIGKPAKNVTLAQAMDYVAGYTLAIDVTARTLQNAAKAKGLPWTEAKGSASSFSFVSLASLCFLIPRL